MTVVHLQSPVGDRYCFPKLVFRSLILKKWPLFLSVLALGLTTSAEAFGQTPREALPALSTSSLVADTDPQSSSDADEGIQPLEESNLEESNLEEASPAERPQPPRNTIPSIEILQPQRQVPGINTLQRPSGSPPNVFIDSEFDHYRLGPGDSFFVSVQRFPDLSFNATVDQQGEVIVPIQGAVPFEGLSLEEAEFLIRRIYNQFVVIRELDPQYVGPPDVTLALTAQRGVEVTILGEVERPGFYPLPQATVTTALLIAGGATNTADLRVLEVQRRLRDGQIISETVDLFTPLQEGTALPDLRLENGDVLIVPRLDPSRLDTYDINLIARSTLAQPEITIRVLNYTGGSGRGGFESSGLGAINVPNGSTFVDAITQMGVNPDRANLGAVALVRFDPETGRAVPLTLDANQAFRGDPTQNPPLRDNDVIIVGRNFINRLTYALNTFTQPFRDVLGFILFFESIGDAFD
jgi:polysaccharide export outer membrane protein